MKRAYADIPDGQIHYRTEGSGEPIILLHMVCSSSDEYTRVIPFLSKTYHPIAMDFLGYGESDKPKFEYQIADHARTVGSFMDSLGIEKASVVGHHSGATVGAEFAVAFQNQSIRGFIVLKCSQEDVNRGRIVDILVESGRERVINLLLTTAINYFLEEEVDVVTCWMLEHWQVFQALRKRGFVKRETPHDLIARPIRDDIPPELYTSKFNWYITMGDSDYF